MNSVLIVDKAPSARRRLAGLLLAQLPRLKIQEAGNGEEALRMIDEHEPDGVFLDTKLPGENGLSLVARTEDFPPVVITSAHGNYATTAFDIDAVDYLLKPIGAKRLGVALKRLRVRVRRLAKLAESNTKVGRATPALRLLGVRTIDGIRFFDVNELTRLYAQDKYSCFRLAGEEYMVEDSLTNLEVRFSSFGFCRAHRSELVNLNHIVTLRLSSTESEILLSDGQHARASRRLLRGIKRRLCVA